METKPCVIFNFSFSFYCIAEDEKVGTNGLSHSICHSGSKSSRLEWLSLLPYNYYNLLDVVS